MQNNYPILADLALVGGGHAQIAVLKAFAMRPLPGLRLTLVTNASRTPYSGLLPGYVGGAHNDEDLHIDLRRLAILANARIIISSVVKIDADRKQIYFDDRPPLEFDVLSLNIGGQPNTALISGAEKNTIPVKPIAAFQKKFNALLRTDLPKKLVVIGGGAAGCELALALSARWKAETGHAPRITLISRSHRLLPQMAPRAGQLIKQKLKDRKIELLLGQTVNKIDTNTLTITAKTLIPFDACFLVTTVAAPKWLNDTGLNLDKNNFIAVTPSLQSTSHPYIFAAGDIASIGQNFCPKAGVFAVRAGRVLAKNLRNFIIGKPLKYWRPQKRYLALIGTSDGDAIAAWDKYALSGRLFWHLKCWIDQRFMKKYKILSMSKPAEIKPFSGLAATLNTNKQELTRNKSENLDPAFANMRCLGCAAKTSHEVLQASMHDAIKLALSMGANPKCMPQTGLETDCATLPELPANARLVQSVDVLSEIVTDPFLLGQIASVHAFSDIYASIAKPMFSLAIINLPESKISIQTNQLTHLLCGALMAHSAAGVKLIGGHTSEGGSLSIGFSVTGSGLKISPPKTPNYHKKSLLLLTKPIGTGVIMAANMQLLASAFWVDDAIQSMIHSNADAADIFQLHNVYAATDVTGFGLARHSLNLSTRFGTKGCELDLLSLPILDGAVNLLEAGIKSSLHSQNFRAIKLSNNITPTSALFQTLFDPQTSGGLLGVFSESDANKALDALLKAGHKAAIIGALNNECDGLHIISEAP